MPGRSKSTLATIAKTLVPHKEWSIYQSQLDDRDLASSSYSYSFETRKFYFADDSAHRAQLMDLYGDGHNPLNIIAIHDVYNTPLHYSAISETLYQVIADGNIPFIGQWGSLGDVCRGVSIVVDHGIFDQDVLKLLDELDQDYAARITRDKFGYFPPLHQP